jgi:hypothetical protein
MSSLQQNWRKVQDRFCLEDGLVRGEVGDKGQGGRNGRNNVCTYDYMNK